MLLPYHHVKSRCSAWGGSWGVGITAFVTSVILLGLFLKPDMPHLLPAHLSNSPTLSPQDAAANSTLGFQKLLALSARPNWRTRGLQAAAGLTGLDFTIPTQPHNPERLIQAFQKLGVDQGAADTKYGSAKAWLAHVDLLKFVIESDLETAFIVEDDVDWDVRIKSQMRLVSDNVRNFTRTREDDSTPFGTNWDVLWLGHCGSLIPDQDTPPALQFEDESRCTTDLYSGWSKRFLQDKLAEGFRQVQMSTVTVCTFGYGVTRSSAQKVLSLVADGVGEAFDVALSGYCQSKKLRCLVVNPQLFNHYEPPAEQGYLSDVHIGDGQGDGTDDDAFEGVKGNTGNIMKSARCEALFNDVCMRPPSDI